MTMKFTIIKLVQPQICTKPQDVKLSEVNWSAAYSSCQIPQLFHMVLLLYIFQVKLRYYIKLIWSSSEHHLKIISTDAVSYAHAGTRCGRTKRTMWVELATSVPPKTSLSYMGTVIVTIRIIVFIAGRKRSTSVRPYLAHSSIVFPIQPESVFIRLSIDWKFFMPAFVFGFTLFGNVIELVSSRWSNFVNHLVSHVKITWMLTESVFESFPIGIPFMLPVHSVGENHPTSTPNVHITPYILYPDSSRKINGVDTWCFITEIVQVTAVYDISVDFRSF